MKYALLVYGHESDRRSAEARELHLGHRALAQESRTAAVIAHFRFRPPDRTTTIRRIGEEFVSRAGPAADANAALRAIYLLESDSADAVRDFAGDLPALGIGGAVEIWPLIEPDLHARPGIHE